MTAVIELSYITKNNSACFSGITHNRSDLFDYSVSPQVNTAEEHFESVFRGIHRQVHSREVDIKVKYIGDGVNIRRKAVFHRQVRGQLCIWQEIDVDSEKQLIILREV